jgi:hypothetical protein
LTNERKISDRISGEMERMGLRTIL